MTFGQSISACFSKYATFSGRASRSEYWWFMLFVGLICLAVSFFDQILYGITYLALSIPSLAVGIRRLHDTDRNGWWYLLVIIPIVNLLLIYWDCQKGTDHINQYGEPVTLV